MGRKGSKLILPILLVVASLISAYFWFDDGISAYSYFWTFLTAGIICQRWQHKHNKGAVSEVAARNAKEAFYIFSSAAFAYSTLQFLVSRGAFDTASATTISEMHNKLVTLRLWMKPVVQLKIWQEIIIISSLVLIARKLPQIQESKITPAAQNIQQSHATRIYCVDGCRFV